MSNAIEVVVRRGVMAARRVRSDVFRTDSGVVRPKTRMQRAQEHAAFDELAETLDELGWHGAWGTNQHAVKLELLRRADKAVGNWRPQ